MLERQIDCGLLQEIWEQTNNIKHKSEVEKMLEINGLKYISCPRPSNSKGVSYGGVAIEANLEWFTLEEIKINAPKNLEVICGLLKPKFQDSKFKRIIVCSFCSPPNKRRNSNMADHIVSTLQILSARYPNSGLILGADRNEMDILPVLNCGLKLRQMVNMGLRHGKILDIIIMNMKSYYNSAIIVPPGVQSSFQDNQV